MSKLNERASIELFHLLFLAQLGQKLDKRRFVLKGGCNLRFFFKSSRYSEDMDLDVQTEPVDLLREKVGGILNSKSFKQILQVRGMEIEHITESKQTETTQRWKLGLFFPGGELPVPTKIEFSRRGMGEAVAFESIDPDIIQLYGLAPVMTSHYPVDVAFQQKVQALISRGATQARDVFDLHLLLASGLGRNPLKKMNPLDRENAQAKAMSIDYAMFKSQVVAYLPPEIQGQYDRAFWDTAVLTVVEALGGGHETG